MRWKKGDSFEPWPTPLPPRRSSRELSIGVSVKLTSIETRIANAIVQPNWFT